MYVYGAFFNVTSHNEYRALLPASSSYYLIATATFVSCSILNLLSSVGDQTATVILGEGVTAESELDIGPSANGNVQDVEALSVKHTICAMVTTVLASDKIFSEAGEIILRGLNMEIL
jgi:hypothetical protein